MRTGFTFCVLAALLAGCGPTSTAIPTSIADYKTMPTDNALAYPRQVVLLHNLSAAGDKDLPLDRRVQAMRLANDLAPQEDLVHQVFAELLADSSTSPEVRTAALEIVLAKNETTWTSTLVGLLPRLQAADPHRAKIVAWVCRHPSRAALGELVKAWASMPVGGATDTLLADMVRRLTGQEWQAALLTAVNSPDFGSGGAAVQVLASREGRAGLGARLDQLTPRTPLANAMQAFWRKFDYVPATERDCQAIEMLWAGRSDALDPASKLYQQWKEQGYRFEICDIALLMGLAADPARQPITRNQLMRSLRDAILSRQHVHMPAATSAASKPEYARDDLDANLERLNMADLWTMQLMYEMLRRPRIQAALRTMSLKDREDTRGAWGGLAFYREGGADAVLYMAKPDAPADDLVYTAPPEAIADGRLALLRFIAHFEKESNAGRAGPTADELRQSRELNIGGAVFTSVSADTFCAHYFSPAGVVVSLGCYPLLEWK